MAIETFSFATSEAEQADQALEQIYRPTAPLTYHRSSRPFTFSIDSYQSGDLHAARTRHSMFTAGNAPPVDDLVIGTLMGSGSLWCGTGGAMPVAAVAGDVLRYPTDQRIDLGWDDLDMAMLRIPMAAVLRAATEAYGARGPTFAFTDLEPVSTVARHRWAALSQLVLRELASPETLLGEPLPSQNLVDLLARTALITFPNTCSEDHLRRGGGAVGPRTLRRAAHFIEEHFEQRLNLSDVARVVGADPAALRYAFRLHHGVTPTEYLQRVRLEVAHRELELGGASHEETVAEIAARLGFLSLSIFVAAYARRFARTPQETLTLGREEW